MPLQLSCSQESSNNESHMMTVAPRLACEQCRSRKVRCNKASPCSACRTAGLQCHTVQRARLPRGKSGKGRSPNSRLEERVARIETLLAQNAKDSARTQDTTDHDHHVSASASLSVKSGTATSLQHGHGSAASPMASDFWQALSEEVNGLREIIEDSGDETEEDNNATGADLTEISALCGPPALLFRQACTTLRMNDNDQVRLFTSHAQNTLLHIYRQRVDSVYKILHWPSVLSILERHRCNISTPTLSENALENSVYFMAICSITVTEAKEIGLSEKDSMLQLCREHLQTLFAQSDLLNSPNLTLLQAFVIYLIGLRACSNGAYTWTLVAVAVRVATALRLGEENSTIHTPFEIQLRRRLLFGIGILDTHSALDRGTIPILPSAALAVPPLNINDADMSPPDIVPQVSDLGITEMSHTAMIYEAMLCQRRLYESSQATPNSWDAWDKKLALINSFEDYVKRTTARIDDTSQPLDQLLKISGHKILTSLQLLLRRPPYLQPRNCVPPWDDFNVARAATDVLEQHLQPISPELGLWAWKNWIQWHALAVVLAELATNPHGADSDRSYAIAKKSFDYYARIVADSESGMLWRPISKLMHRVEVVRERKRTELVAANLDQNGSIVQPKSDLTDPSNFADNITFEVPDWTTDGQVYNDFLGNEGNGEVEMPWLAWDAFIQDIHLSDV